MLKLQSVNGKIDSLEILRAVCAACIVLCHFSAVSFGQFAVYPFMMLSGFVSLLVLEGQKRPPFAFFLRQCKKILPLYEAVTAVSFLIGLIFPSLFHTVEISVKNLLLSALLIPYAGGSFYPLYPPGWYLCSEMALLLLLLLLGRLCRRHYLLLFTAAVLLLRTAETLAESYGIRYAALSLLGSDMDIAFALGAWMYVFWTKGQRKTKTPKEMPLYPAADAVCLLLLCMADASPAASSHPIGLCAADLLLSAAMLFCCVRTDVSGLVSENGFWMQMGGCSAAVYLTHYFLVMFSERVLGVKGQSAAGVMLIALTMAACFAAGWVLMWLRGLIFRKS